MTSDTTSLMSDSAPVGKEIYWPDICSKSYFDRLIAAAWTAYIANRSTALPDPKAIAEFLGVTSKALPKIAQIISTPEFAERMGKRGIRWESDNLGITPEQSFAMNIMNDPSTGSFAMRLKRAGINHSKWNAWMKEPVFRSVFNKMTEDTLAESTGHVHTALVNKASNGDMRAIEFYYQITGRFDPAREININMQAILMRILEVLTMRITDANLLSQIGEDLENIIQGEVVKETRPALAYSPAPAAGVDENVYDPSAPKPTIPQPIRFDLP